MALTSFREVVKNYLLGKTQDIMNNSSGQHTKSFHRSRIPKNAVPLGFCCGGFSSTADYASATKPNLR
jgi:hypothetical protein